MATSGQDTSPKQDDKDTNSTKMKSAFQRADSDSKGKIPCDQFSTAAQAAGLEPTNDELDELFQHFDKTDDSGINFDEFIDMMAYLEDGCEKDNEAILRKAFKKFDRDGSGFISPEELRYVVCHTGEKLSLKEAEEFIEMFDANKDGQLSWEEFVTFVKSSMLGQGEEEEENGDESKRVEETVDAHAKLINHE